MHAIQGCVRKFNCRSGRMSGLGQRQGGTFFENDGSVIEHSWLDGTFAGSGRPDLDPACFDARFGFGCFGGRGFRGPRFDPSRTRSKVESATFAYRRSPVDRDFDPSPGC